MTRLGAQSFEAFQGAAGAEMTDRLKAIREASGKSHLSLLRVLDIILWMEGLWLRRCARPLVTTSNIMHAHTAMGCH